MQGTWRRIRTRLSAGDGLFYRSEHHRGREGAFVICSFWVADFLARGGGSLDEARHVFEAALRYTNDVGLLAEEVDPATGEALGNFPQAYSHVGVIAAALAIEQRAVRERRKAA
jgi:GH15 family glucan-1,4-alpha-glucosidase